MVQPGFDPEQPGSRVLHNKYLLNRAREGIGRWCWRWRPAGPLILFLEFGEGGLFSCQLTPPRPCAELWVTLASPGDLLSTAGRTLQILQ